MKTTRVELADQVVDFIRSLAPDARKAIHAGLHAIERGGGDTKPLQDELAGWHRLRVNKYRIVFRRALEDGKAVAYCDFAERREFVYEQFEALLMRMKKEAREE